MSHSPSTAELRTLGKLCRSSSSPLVEKHLDALQSLYGCPILQRVLAEHRLGDDETLLHISIHNDNEHVITALVARGAPVDARGFRSCNRAALHEAARVGRVAHVRELLKCGARVDATKSGDWTPLMLAARNMHAECARALRAAGARSDLRNMHGACALYLAARSGCVATVITCLDNTPAPPTRNGRTPLHAAATAGSASVVAVLLQAGALPTATEATGMTPAHEAAAHGHLAVLIKLLEADNAAPALADAGGYTALHHAALGGHAECARILAHLSGVLDKAGYAAAELAIRHRHHDIAAMLVGAGDKVRSSLIDSLKPSVK